ncbi:hypothetical protein [Sphingosinicella sp. BN140058]|uniref:hypothetical protein n=1 Tax=Sphingosinicella sp. BN140058 TaxID=1892855 RepID=UPI0010104AA3|nr:hypothetical protein [Sphingosinicella sp. BN140058]QAY78169.1 hypothetical protein ETR14_17765 [Sphingosinicella sp. BN140058]
MLRADAEERNDRYVAFPLYPAVTQSDGGCAGDGQLTRGRLTLAMRQIGRYDALRTVAVPTTRP